MATSILTKYKQRTFVYRPSHTSRAAQGLCSWCHRWASFMLVGPVDSKRGRFALCKLHTELWRLNRHRDDLRVMIRSDDEVGLSLVGNDSLVLTKSRAVG